MSSRIVYVRTSTSGQIPTSASGELIVSDVSPDGTLSHNIHRLITRVGNPIPAARDFFTLAGAIYVADKRTPRWSARDAWTRSFDVRMPVADVRIWENARAALENALTFLTGDHWRLRFRQGFDRPARARRGERRDAVALFSGGLDSLIGAIDALADNQRILLVGHHDSTMTQGPQDRLYAALSREYGDLVDFVPVRVKPDPRQSLPFPLPRGTENSTRSRSLVFIAMGLVGASALGRDVPLRIAENGLIALNVPLVSERSGSCSTRTTHPYFLELLSEALAILGIVNPLLNPYSLHTKGEMLAECSNAPLVRRLSRLSVSCAHPEQGCWDGQRDFEWNCGYCYPCIIRRAALHAIDSDRAVHYREDVCTSQGFVNEPVTGRDLRAALCAISAPGDPLAPLLSGPVPLSVGVQDLARLHARGLEELRTLFSEKGSRELRTFAGLET